jgi:adenosylmethionine-8-amino-7-oxononanoate aminotransferase
MLVEGGVLENGARVGAQLRKKLEELARRHPAVSEVRGVGMLLGLGFKDEPSVLDRPRGEVPVGARVQAEARKRGLLLRASPWFAAVAPPLTTTEAEADEIVAVLEAAVTATEEALGKVPAGMAR